VLAVQQRVYPNLDMSGHPAMATYKGGQQPGVAAAAPLPEAPPSPSKHTGPPSEEFKVETDAEDGVDPFVSVCKVIPAPKSHAGARSVVYLEVVSASVAWGVPKVERADKFNQLVVKATVKYSKLDTFLRLTDMAEPEANDEKGRNLYAYKPEAAKLRQACDEFKVNVDNLVVHVDDWRKGTDHDLVYTYTFSHELEPSSQWKSGETTRGTWFLIPFVGMQQFADDTIPAQKKLKTVDE